MNYRSLEKWLELNIYLNRMIVMNKTGALSLRQLAFLMNSSKTCMVNNKKHKGYQLLKMRIIS